MKRTDRQKQLYMLVKRVINTKSMSSIDITLAIYEAINKNVNTTTMNHIFIDLTNNLKQYIGEENEKNK